jgi:hypothetical protein
LRNSTRAYPAISALRPISDMALCRDKCSVVPQAAVSSCSKIASYSNTWSALASSEVGTVRPSALAVFGLRTSSNSLSWRTGRSAGFSPLRMRPRDDRGRRQALFQIKQKRTKEMSSDLRVPTRAGGRVQPIHSRAQSRPYCVPPICLHHSRRDTLYFLRLKTETLQSTGSPPRDAQTPP